MEENRCPARVNGGEKIINVRQRVFRKIPYGTIMGDALAGTRTDRDLRRDSSALAACSKVAGTIHLERSRDSAGATTAEIRLLRGLKHRRRGERARDNGVVIRESRVI